MTRSEARLYRERWAVVNQLIVEEERRKTWQQRMNELGVLYEAGKALGWRRASPDETQGLWDRWQQLRTRLGVM